jgi:energy-coupling factor transport system permease protein
MSVVQPRANAPELHPATWVVWTLVAAGTAMLTRNPLYLSVLLGIAVLHYLTASQGLPETHGWRDLWKLAASLSLLIVPFNALNVHVGSHVLFRVPSNWPIVGGPITLEATLWGLGSALSLVTLITLFAAFNLRVGQAQMLRLTPAFIYEAGLIVSIALTFVPQMMISAREIREAQRIRGHRMRRLGDMLPFLMALLTTGLERSFQLAESIEARGFGNVRHIPSWQDITLKALTLVALGGTFSGYMAFTYFDGVSVLGWAVFISSLLLLLGIFWAQGRRVIRTHYRRERWTWRDGVVVALAAVVLGAVAWTLTQHVRALGYDPYQDLLPPFRGWLGLALAALIAPALLARSRADAPGATADAPGHTPIAHRQEVCDDRG